MNDVTIKALREQTMAGRELKQLALDLSKRYETELKATGIKMPFVTRYVSDKGIELSDDDRRGISLCFTGAPLKKHGPLLILMHEALEYNLNPTPANEPHEEQ